ncbi:hypothetical protein N0Y54_37355 [Nostoc punctiforme UO1]|uniref:hypothetical protein n=1 Tax=Nostoc punctiforme TaxID=272131 RepID=UPI00309EB386
MTQSTASNLLLQEDDCQERILLPATDANAEVMEILVLQVRKAIAVQEKCNRHLNEI